MVAIDMRGRGGPMVTVQLSNELRATPGELVEVLTDRQSVVEYLMLWCKESGTRIISIDTIQGEGDVRLIVRREQAADDEETPQRRRHSTATFR